MACKACRARKIKCDRTRPICQNCQQRSSHCTYAGERRTRRWTVAGLECRPLSRVRSPGDGTGAGTGSGSQSSTNQVIFVATSANGFRRGVQQSQQASTETATTITADSVLQSARMAPSNLAPHPEAAKHQPPPLPSPQESCVHLTSNLNGHPHATAGAAYDSPVIPQTLAGSSASYDDNLVDRILDGDSTEDLNYRNPALWMRMTDGDEYTGPSSGISAISDLGLDWVRRNVPDSDVLCKTVQDIRNAVLNHIRQPKCLDHTMPFALSSPAGPVELPHSELMRYVDAYFSTVQIIFPILDRVKFLAQLATWGLNPTPGPMYSWQALLNAVLASGCRAALSDETAGGFKLSGREAWGYFQNALSFESRILHDSTDLLAVQAMAVMTVFAQGLSSPQRQEYTLSSIASRLAQGLALSRNPSPEWDLTEEEKRERSRVFWVIYCLDKMIALRCGRPSVLCDDEISCPFPRNVTIVQTGRDGSPGSTTKQQNFDFFRCFTKLSRICGKVSRMLYSVTALYMPSEQLIKTVNCLMQDLESWVDMLPEEILPGKPLGRISHSFDALRDQIIVLHASYYYVLCAIYRRFTPIFTYDGKCLEHLIDRRSHRSHIEAARSIVLLTKHLDVESFVPAWIVFYYPFTALTTIFIHVVSNPPDDSTQSDIALMETIVGFFGRLEYITSGEASFTKTTEFVRLARNVTEKYGQRSTGQKASGSNTTVLDQAMPDMDMSLQNTTAAGNNMLGRTDEADFSSVGGPCPHPTGTGIDAVFNGQATQANADGSEQPRLDSRGPNFALDLLHPDQPMDSDVDELFFQAHRDAGHVPWFGDWISAGL
ncbi:fungal specific transcription factor domain containing [Fusarium agapanthi]|uniref:Fungal specific transcription factor domain containing n=1 Tax=Fusarium agapanthi TaxID=1803897 RepID=A0A9P5E8E5_9HYPO|nr:fungal specific transcription factor domain containing [Fusarium agapanthi]